MGHHLRRLAALLLFLFAAVAVAQTATPTRTPTNTPTATPTDTPTPTLTPTSPPCVTSPSQGFRHIGAGTYQVTPDDGIIFADPSLGAVTINLESNPAMCRKLVIKRLPGIYNVVINGNGKTIDGYSSRTMATINSAIKIVFQPQFNWGIV
jgi:hypothetical protein